MENYEIVFGKYMKLAEKGFEENEIAEIVGVSKSTVQRINTAITYCKKSNSYSEFLGIIPESVKMQYSSERLKFIWEQCTGTEAVIEQNVRREPQTVIPTAEPSKDYTVYLSTLIVKQTETNELLTQLMDTVIPKYVSDIQNELSIIPDYTQTLMGIIKVVQDIAPSLTSTLGETVRINLNKYCTDLLNQMKNDAYRSEAIKKSVQAIETKKFWSK